MPKGFAKTKPWTCRIYRQDFIWASLKIAAQDGTPITRKNATKTAILIVSLLQEPTNTGCQCRLAHRLGDDAAAALRELAVELGDDFRVVMVSPEGVATAEGFSTKAAEQETMASRKGMRVVDPTGVW
jgi:hypothetical protein